MSILEHIYEYIGVSLSVYVRVYWSMYLSILEYVYEYIGVCL